MKKFIGVLFLVLLTAPALANKPVVTMTLVEKTSKFYVYTASFLTDSSVVDSVYIYPSGTTPFNIEGIGYEDSLVTVALTTTEDTADSVRFTILYEVSALASPTSTQYSTAFTDATSFTNQLPGGVSRFYIRRYAGLSRTMRIFVKENNTTKDLPQTVTLQILIPRQ